MKKVFAVIGSVICFFAILFCLQWLGIINYKFFAPKRENARREVFENTQSYVEGKRQEITKYYNEWRKADDVEKQAIRSIVLQSFSNFNTDYFTTQQYGWYNEITK